MRQHPRVLGVVPIIHYPTLVFSSESATEGTLHPGDYALLYPHWYQVNDQGSLQLVGKTAITARQASLTNVGGWERDLESVLKGPLDSRLAARQADLPYVVFLDPVCNRHGGFVNAELNLKRFRLVLREAGLPEMRIHDLRHTAASLLILSMKAPANLVQELLGHSQVSTTLSIYTHSDHSMQRKMMDDLNDLFGGIW